MVNGKWKLKWNVLTHNVIATQSINMFRFKKHTAEIASYYLNKIQDHMEQPNGISINSLKYILEQTNKII